MTYLKNSDKRTRTPFGSRIIGPHYTYVLVIWEDLTIVPIYVGRGRGTRVLCYYGLPLIRRSKKSLPLANYFSPKIHNLDLGVEIARLRAIGRDIIPIPKDHYDDLDAAKRCEKELIRKYGRRDIGTGTLFNRNSGG